MSTDVLAEFFVEASEALEKMAAESARLARAFRGHALDEAHAGLTAFTAELRQFPVMVTVLTGPLAIDPDLLVVNGVTVEEQLSQFGAWIESLIEAHRQSDWLTVADVMELDFEPLLRGWSLTLRECLEHHVAAVGAGPARS